MLSFKNKSKARFYGRIFGYIVISKSGIEQLLYELSEWCEGAGYTFRQRRKLKRIMLKEMSHYFYDHIKGNKGGN